MSSSPALSTSTSIVEEPLEQRRTLTVLLVAQILSGAGLAAGITVGALLAEQMLGSSRFSGLPTVFFTIGSAAAAVGVGRVSQNLGRRAGLSAGYLTGALGSVGVVVAASLGNVVLLFASLLVYGAGVATNLQARYAGADLAAPSRRGRAVSIVLVATAIGAIIGPNLVSLTGALATAVGIPPLAGPFLLAAAAYAAAGVVLWVMLRPDPLLLARSIAAAKSSRNDQAVSGSPGSTAPAVANESGSRRWSWALASGAGIMILTQLIMVAIMTMTPIHIEHHGHSIRVTGIVIAAHIAGMFLPSPFSGWLVDRFGCGPARRLGTSGFGGAAGRGPRAARTRMESRTGQRHNPGDRRGTAGHAGTHPGRRRPGDRTRGRRWRAELGTDCDGYELRDARAGERVLSLVDHPHRSSGPSRPSCAGVMGLARLTGRRIEAASLKVPPRSAETESSCAVEE